MQPRGCVAVHVRRSRREAGSISRAWAAFHPSIPLGIVDHHGRSMAEAITPLVAHQRPTPDQPVVVLVPEDLSGAEGPGVGDGVAELTSAFRDRDDVVVLTVQPTSGVAAGGSNGVTPLEVGDRVEVHTDFNDAWVAGFEIAAIVAEGYRVRRESDHSLLPGYTSEADLRPLHSHLRTPATGAISTGPRR